MSAIVLFWLACAAPSRAAGFVELSSFGGAGQTWKQSLEAGATFGKAGVYSISARERSFRVGRAFSGSEVEYSAALKRELFHATVEGRLGTAPPNAQQAAYHLAQGSVLFTFYGLELGPEHPELSAVVWESSGPAPAPEALDREWVTRVRGVYSNVDHHLEGRALTTIVENVWQLDVSETWRERFSLKGEFGFDRYPKPLPNSVGTIVKDDVDYLGGAFPILGWPNNWAGAEADARVWRRLELWAAGTRLNLLNNQLVLLGGGGARWAAPFGWSFGAGYFYRHRRGADGGGGVSLSATYRW